MCPFATALGAIDPSAASGGAVAVEPGLVEGPSAAVALAHGGSRPVRGRGGLFFVEALSRVARSSEVEDEVQQAHDSIRLRRAGSPAPELSFRKAGEQGS